MTHFSQYCDGIYRKTGVNCFWIIKNSQQVLKILHRVNTTSNAIPFDSFDFATLYTNIPHDSLKSNLKKLIKEAYKVRGAKYLRVNWQGIAHWSKIRSTSNCCTYIDQNELMDLLQYLVDNIYVEVGNKVFRQTIGIPMGTDCAPMLANLFLFFYEYNYMKNLLKNNSQLARKFSFTVRYIDDLLTLNNTAFDKEIPNIYPKELLLKRTTEEHNRLSYLDLQITIDNRKYITTLYDKRDAFGFDIVNLPYLDSNIPVRSAYGVYTSQLVRIGRICEDFTSFVDRHRLLTARLIKQGFSYSKLFITFIKFTKKHSQIFIKLGGTLRQHIE